MNISKKFLKVEDIENYDTLNLLHVNLLRAMSLDVEDCIVQLSWIRI